MAARTKLTALAVERAHRSGKAVLLSDGDGLYLRKQTRDGASWTLRYRFAGKEHWLTLGNYPDMALAQGLPLRAPWRRLPSTLRGATGVASGSRAARNSRTSKRFSHADSDNISRSAAAAISSFVSAVTRALMTSVQLM